MVLFMAVQEVERDEVQRLMREGARVLDALPYEDYARQHLQARSTSRCRSSRRSWSATSTTSKQRRRTARTTSVI